GRALDLAVEDAVAVVEQAVGQVGGVLVLAAGPVDAAQQPAEPAPVGAAGARLGGAERRADRFDRAAAERRQQRAGALEQVGPGHAPVLDGVLEEVGLVGHLRGGDGGDERGGAAVVGGGELGAAGRRGRVRDGGEEGGVGLAAAGEEVDADAALGARADRVGGDGEALADEEDAADVEERVLGDDRAAHGDAQPLGVFADESARLIDQYVAHRPQPRGAWLPARPAHHNGLARAAPPARTAFATRRAPAVDGWVATPGAADAEDGQRRRRPRVIRP